MLDDCHRFGERGGQLSQQFMASLMIMLFQALQSASELAVDRAEHLSAIVRRMHQLPDALLVCVPHARADRVEGFPINKRM